MFLVNPSYQILAASNKYGLPHNYSNSNNLIEVAGRTCYKSEDKIPEDSAKTFIEMLKTKGHNAMIEHSWQLRYYDTINLPYYKFLNFMQVRFIGTCVAGNQRAFEEWEFNMKEEYESISQEDEMNLIYKEKRWDMLSATVRFICNRGVSHELVRHRPPSFAQESTRYCNYSKDKFQNQLTFIIPPWFDWIKEGEYSWGGKSPEGLTATEHIDAWFWFKAIDATESTYLSLITEGQRPEEARDVLPNALKTEIVVSADLQEWKHIFKLRTAQVAHPQMRELMVPLHEDFKKLYPEVFE